MPRQPAGSELYELKYDCMRLDARSMKQMWWEDVRIVTRDVIGI